MIDPGRCSEEWGRAFVGGDPGVPVARLVPGERQPQRKRRLGGRGRQHVDARLAVVQALGGRLGCGQKSHFPRDHGTAGASPSISAPRACGPRCTKASPSSHPQGAAAPVASPRNCDAQVPAPAVCLLSLLDSNTAVPFCLHRDHPLGSLQHSAGQMAAPPPTRTASVSPRAGTPTSCTEAFPCRGQCC